MNTATFTEVTAYDCGYRAGKRESKAEIDELVEMLEMVRSNAHKFSKDQGLFLWTTIFSDQGWIELSALIAKHKEKE